MKLRPMKFRELERIIKDDGWFFVEAEGSHYHYKHAEKTGKVTIPFHDGDLNKKTINSALRQAGLKQEAS
jgi:predicted RNA binding protein YcfA (HicA-like mRNA interferase family)